MQLSLNILCTFDLLQFNVELGSFWTSWTLTALLPHITIASKVGANDRAAGLRSTRDARSQVVGEDRRHLRKVTPTPHPSLSFSVCVVRYAQPGHRPITTHKII